MDGWMDGQIGRRSSFYHLSYVSSHSPRWCACSTAKRQAGRRCEGEMHLFASICEHLSHRLPATYILHQTCEQERKSRVFFSRAQETFLRCSALSTTSSSSVVVVQSPSRVVPFEGDFKIVLTCKICTNDRSNLAVE